MKGVTIGDYYLNIMIYKQYVTYVKDLADYTIIFALASYIFFFLGLIIKKVIPLYIFSTLYTVYLFISCCYYYYNFVTLLLSGTYRTYYNAYDYLTDLYFEDHPELDYYTEYSNIRSKLKTKFYLESFCHLFVILLM
eukprot:jgi/Orpsp1_1/1176501/evm.model.c7180000057852.1